MTISAKTAVAGVLGWPISHSKSPLLHNHWLTTHGVDGLYAAFPVRPEQLLEAVLGARALHLRGLNLTVPHKELVVPMCDDLTPAARSIGAVNTLVIKEDHLLGDNTDAYGFLTNLTSTCADWSADRPAVVLGAGGAARAAVFALLDAHVPEVRVVNRTTSRVEALAEDFGDRVRPFTWSDMPAAFEDAGLITNTTVLGMSGQPELETDVSKSPSDCVIYDIVYTPKDTALLRQASALNRPVVGGLGMLIHQAVPAFSQWFGITPAVDDAVVQLLDQA